MEFDDRIKDIHDLQPGLELNGIVNNITAFGCFVDLGIKENGLVHISQLCDRFISSPAEVGERASARDGEGARCRLRAWSHSIDYERVPQR